MTTKNYFLNTRVKIGEMNSFVSAVDEKKALLGEDANANVLSLVARVSEKRVQLNEAINRSAVKSNRKQYADAMKQSYRNFHSLIKSYEAMTDSTVYLSVQVVLPVVEKYYASIVGATSQKVCHSNVLSLIADVEEVSVANAVSSMFYAGTLFDKLKTAQANYVAHYASVHNDREMQLAQSNATKLRAELLELINHEFLLYLRAIKTVDADGCGEFADAVFALVKEQNIIAKRRTSKAKNQEADSQEEEMA
ncbi:MAG: hypothetical protein ACK5LR_09875 [Mangrovibacterium sp.]